MLEQLKSLAVFATVAEEQSFRGAAVKLSLSPSVISYHVSKLEKELGVALILRSTRSLALTGEGEVLFQHASAMLQRAKEGLGDFSGSASRPVVQFRVAMPGLLSYHPVFLKIVEFAKTQKGIHLHLIASDRTVDLLKNRFDIAIRMGALKDSELKVRKIGEDQRSIVASPSYLDGKILPEHPEALESWDFIRFSPVPKGFEFRKEGEPLAKVTGNYPITTDNAAAAKRLAMAGMGIAGLPASFVADELKSGALQTILPEWEGQTLGIYAVWPENTAYNPVHRKFISSISEM